MTRGRSGRDRRRHGGGKIKWILPALIPLAAAVWFFLQGDEARRGILESVPEGAGGRARNAALGFGLLVGLAWIVLPIAYWSQRGTRRALAWYLGRSAPMKVVLFPLAVLIALGATLSSLLFGADAIAVVAAFLLTLLLGVWVVEPGFLGGQEALRDLLERLAP